jgi:hypothetical protein
MLVYAARCMQPAVRSPLYAARCMQPAVRRPLYAARCTQPAVRSPQYAARCTQPSVRSPLYAARCKPHKSLLCGCDSGLFHFANSCLCPLRPYGAITTVWCHYDLWCHLHLHNKLEMQYTYVYYMVLIVRSHKFTVLTKM